MKMILRKYCSCAGDTVPASLEGHQPHMGWCPVFSEYAALKKVAALDAAVTQPTTKMGIPFWERLCA